MTERPSQIMLRHKDVIEKLHRSIQDIQRIFEIAQKEANELPHPREWNDLGGSELDIDKVDAFMDELKAFYEVKAESFKSIFADIDNVHQMIPYTFSQEFWDRAAIPEEEDYDTDQIPF